MFISANEFAVLMAASKYPPSPTLLKMQNVANVSVNHDEQPPLMSMLTIIHRPFLGQTAALHSTPLSSYPVVALRFIRAFWPSKYGFSSRQFMFQCSHNYRSNITYIL